MFSSGNVTVYVSNMGHRRPLLHRDLGAEAGVSLRRPLGFLVELGKGLTIGLHPASSEMPAGRRGSMSIGLELTGSIHEAVRILEGKGVKFNEPVINDGKAGSFVSFNDPDGNLLYLAQLNWSHVEQGEGKYQEVRG